MNEHAGCEHCKHENPFNFDPWTTLMLAMLFFGWPSTRAENKEHINIESIYIEGPHFPDK